MCTVSFLPAEDDFHLAMNRDEFLARPEALSPEILQTGGHRSLYPRECDSGTRVGVNEMGLAFALLDWSHQPPHKGSGTCSPSTIIPELLAATTIAETKQRLAALDFTAMNPFRLVAACRQERSLWEWRYRGDNVPLVKQIPWRRAHWFSSYLDEASASRARQSACDREAWVSSPASAGWLHGLHRLHYPAKCERSICMHHDEVGTVSHTEISVNTRDVVMKYSAGPPCLNKPRATKMLPLLLPIGLQGITPALLPKSDE